MSGTSQWWQTFPLRTGCRLWLPTVQKSLLPLHPPEQGRAQSPPLLCTAIPTGLGWVWGSPGAGQGRAEDDEGQVRPSPAGSIAPSTSFPSCPRHPGPGRDTNHRGQGAQEHFRHHKETRSWRCHWLPPPGLSPSVRVLKSMDRASSSASGGRLHSSRVST